MPEIRVMGVPRQRSGSRTTFCLVWKLKIPVLLVRARAFALEITRFSCRAWVRSTMERTCVNPSSIRALLSEIRVILCDSAASLATIGCSQTGRSGPATVLASKTSALYFSAEAISLSVAIWIAWLSFDVGLRNQCWRNINKYTYF